MQFNHRWTQVNTDKNRRESLFPPRQEWSPIGASDFPELNCLLICVHLCPSLVKAFFNCMGTAKARRGLGWQPILQGANGTASATSSILTATNVATPIASWTTNTTGGFGSGGVFSNAIPLDSYPARFFGSRRRDWWGARSGIDHHRPRECRRTTSHESGIDQI